MTYRPGDPAGIGFWNEFRAPSDLNATQRDVLEVWTAYWEVTAEAFNTGGENLVGDQGLKSLQDVAVEGGKAWRLTFNGAANRGRTQIFTVGPVTYTVGEVDVKGNRATVRGCVKDGSYEVDRRGKTIKPPPGASILADQLVRSAGKWRVAAILSLPGACTK